MIEQAVQHQLSDVPLARLDYTGELEVDLLTIVRAYMETIAQHGALMPALLTQIPQHPELKQAMAAPMANFQSIVNIIQRYQAEGRLTQEPPLTAMADLIGPLMVEWMFRHAIPELPIPAVDAQKHVEFYLNGKGA